MSTPTRTQPYMYVPPTVSYNPALDPRINNTASTSATDRSSYGQIGEYHGNFAATPSRRDPYEVAQAVSNSSFSAGFQISTRTNGELPPTVEYSQPGSAGLQYDQTSSPKKFKILNDLERRGLADKMRTLDEQLASHPDSRGLQLALANAQLLEMRSCYQMKKDQIHDLQSELDQSRENDGALRQQIEAQANELILLKRDLEVASLQRNELARSMHSLVQESELVKRKSDALDDQLTSVKKRHGAELAHLQTGFQKQLGTLERLLDGERISAFNTTRDLEQKLNAVHSALSKKGEEVKACESKITKLQKEAAKSEVEFNRFAAKLEDDAQSLQEANKLLQGQQAQQMLVMSVLKNKLDEANTENSALLEKLREQEARFLAIADLLQKRPCE